MVARAVLARWCAGSLGRSGAARLEHGGVGARWPAQGHGGAGEARARRRAAGEQRRRKRRRRWLGQGGMRANKGMACG